MSAGRSLTGCQRLVVVGGGASGVFAAIAAARSAAVQATNTGTGTASRLQVTVLEQGGATLRKLLASGGGRCNVMHAMKPPRELVRSYPRGARELLGAFSARFSSSDTWQWFVGEGVALKVEPDGRVFPSTDRAETIASALRHAAADAGVEIMLGAKVLGVHHGVRDGASMFTVEYEDKSVGRRKIDMQCSMLLLATGSAPVGYSLARGLGHRLIKPYPSLFSFRVESIDCTPLAGLAGLALPNASITLEPGTASEFGDGSSHDQSRRKHSRTRDAARLTQRGPLLVTHRGLSGPAALRLSAFGAAELRDCGYSGTLVIRTVEHPDGKRQRKGAEAAARVYCRDELWRHIAEHGGQPVMSAKRPAFAASLPRRWWGALVAAAIPARLQTSTGSKADSEAEAQLRWANLSKEEVGALAQALAGLRVAFKGKDTNKEEFVSAGGADLAEVSMSTMQSKLVQGLYFSGEVLDVDGITGGFNFQAAWTTGHTAGQAVATAVP
eukprot:COSAG02_NODE_680_length_18551_cov_16.648060_2_plen_498_part_00